MKLAIYGHGGSQNHGNEAIVRGVHQLFPDAELKLFSFCPEADVHFGLDSISRIMPIHILRLTYLDRILNKLRKHLPFLNKIFYKRYFRPFIDSIDSDTIYLLEAGDQYCELGEQRKWYAFLNSTILEKGAKTVMLGCTINPDLLMDTNTAKDINNYSLVISRECITYNALKKIRPSVLFAPCPAFAMQPKKIDLPVWCNGLFIAFNVGFLAQGNEQYYDMLMNNFKKAINWVLENTDYHVALIPHVNWSYQSTDFTALDILYKQFSSISKSRVHYVEEHDAQTQKYIISKSLVFVSLRTHAAISGLSSSTPTLIAGYKTKSKGLAQDIFSDKFDMLADVQSLNNDNVITDKLKVIIDNEKAIRNYYKDKLPSYLNKLNIIVDSIKKL